MKLALVGLPGSGKTTLINALTGVALPVAAFDQRPNLAEAKVPDPRLGELTKIFSPKKTTPAVVKFTDVPGILPGEGTAAARLGYAREADALLHVIRFFDSPTYPHPLGELDCARDQDALQSELALADLAIFEKRVEKLSAKKGKVRFSDEEAVELELLERVVPELEEKLTLLEMELNPAERVILRGFSPLTLKPQLLLVNLDDGDLSARPLGDAAQVYLGAKLEADLIELDDEEREMFMEEMGLSELAGGEVVRAGYELLGLQAFFTVGEDECRAWTVEVGANAVEAAGCIHSDLARGFIRAEVFSYDDFIACGGKMSGVRDAGKLRVEGKEYTVLDGDILNILFNV